MKLLPAKRPSRLQNVRAKILHVAVIREHIGQDLPLTYHQSSIHTGHSINLLQGKGSLVANKNMITTLDSEDSTIFNALGDAVDAEDVAGEAKWGA